MADRCPKGRAAMRFTAADVLAMRKRREAGQTLGAIAEAFDTCTTTVWDIATRRTWRHV